MVIDRLPPSESLPPPKPAHATRPPGGVSQLDYAILTAVLGPNLRHIDYNICQLEYRLQHVRIMTYRVPSLTKLRVAVDNLAPAGFVTAIEGLQSLEILDAEFQSVSNSLWDLLARHQSLKKVTLGQLAASEAITFPRDGLPRLKSLELGASRMEWVVLFTTSESFLMSFSVLTDSVMVDSLRSLKTEWLQKYLLFLGLLPAPKTPNRMLYEYQHLDATWMSVSVTLCAFR